MTVDLSEIEWFKSSHSGSGGDCVETAWMDSGHVGVRDSKNPAGPALRFGRAAWGAFTAGVRAGEFSSVLD